MRLREIAMSIILIIGVLFLLFNGGRFDGHRRVYCERGGLGGMFGLLLIIFILSFVFGGLGGAYPR
jgi:hypothetical protein